MIAASVLMSFVLLFFEWRKARTIIRSGDISYAFTSSIAYRFYAIRSYPHYCFFSQIQNSRKTIDLLAFFVYFRFKGWKRLVFAEAPRQFLNFVFLYNATLSMLETLDSNRLPRNMTNFYKLLTDPRRVSSANLINFLVLMTTVGIWFITFLTLLVAFVIYIPLLCNIRGNLKEYCVHKIDKR